MKLYYSPGACSLAPHIVLEEINIPYEALLVSTMDGSTRSAEFLEINFKGHVPALNIDGQIITEAAAIMTYLTLQYSSKPMLSNTPMGLARKIEWMSWLSCTHAFIIAQNWRTERFTDDIHAYPGIQAKGLLNLKAVYAQIDARLNSLEWALAEEYSIVDPYLLVFFRWGNRLGIDMRSYKNWTIHAQRMAQRKAVKLVLEKEGISIWK